MKFRLDTESAYIWWTFDEWDRAAQSRRDENSFGPYTLDGNRIPHFAVRSGEIAFDKPDGWRNPSVIVLRESDGTWAALGDGWKFEAVRADTPDAIVLTGRWSERSYGAGPFIAVFPKSVPPL